jgi:hypothetical protein
MINLDFDKDLNKVTEYDICERLAEQNFNNPLFQDALNKIALAEEEVSKAKDRLIATVRLVDIDGLNEVKRQIETHIAQSAAYEAAMERIKQKSQEHRARSIAESLKRSEERQKSITLRDTYDNKVYTTTILSPFPDSPKKTSDSWVDKILGRKK